MFGEEKKIKDSVANPMLVLKDTSFSISYKKTNKLITALYMITDIMDKDEPIRNKLRILGLDIISDINASPSSVCVNISQVMSFLDIALALNIISEMNAKILQKEFLELNTSIKESLADIAENKKNTLDLSKFLSEEDIDKSSHFSNTENRFSRPIDSISLGVQRGGTLLKALSDKKIIPAIRGSHIVSDKNTKHQNVHDFEILRKQRQSSIMNIIKNNGGSATIKDINTKINIGVTGGSVCGEKTLQRELVSMTKEGVLYKKGEKRWSRYFLK